MVKKLSLYDILSYKQRHCLGCTNKGQGWCQCTYEQIHYCYHQRRYVKPEWDKQLDSKGRLIDNDP